METTMENESIGMTEVLRAIEASARMERLIAVCDEEIRNCERYRERASGANGYTADLHAYATYQERIARIYKLKDMLHILHDNGKPGHNNSDEEVYEWLFSNIRTC